MSQPPEEADLAELLERAARYERSGRLGKAARQLAQKALDPQERERLRRHRIGTEARIAEDAVHAVLASEPVWALLARHGLPEDASPRELDDIARFLLGRRSTKRDTVPHVSIRSARDPLRISIVTTVLPDLPREVDSYRYAALEDPATGSLTPFLVLLRSRARGDNEPVAMVHLGATFLRHEQEFGLIDPERLETLATLVEQDLANVVATHRALQEI